MCGSGSIETTPAWQAPYLPMVEGGGAIGKTDPKHIRRVHEHTRSFPREASHYSWANPKRKQVNSELARAKMYYLYLEKYEPAAYCAPLARL